MPARVRYVPEADPPMHILARLYILCLDCARFVCRARDIPHLGEPVEHANQERQSDQINRLLEQI
jgi:hypothetical protein